MYLLFCSFLISSPIFPLSDPTNVTQRSQVYQFMKLYKYISAPPTGYMNNLNPLQVSQELPRDILPPYSSHCHKPFEGDLARTPSPIGNKKEVDQKAS